MEGQEAVHCGIVCHSKYSKVCIKLVENISNLRGAQTQYAYSKNSRLREIWQYAIMNKSLLFIKQMQEEENTC